MKILSTAGLAVALLAATPVAPLAHGTSGARGAPVPTSLSLNPHPLRFNSRPFVFRLAFPHARFGSARFLGWGGGAYSADVAAFDDEGMDPDNLYFRVQEPFGPGDLGRPAAPPYEGAPPPRLPPEAER